MEIRSLSPSPPQVWSWSNAAVQGGWSGPCLAKFWASPFRKTSQLILGYTSLQNLFPWVEIPLFKTCVCCPFCFWHAAPRKVSLFTFSKFMLFSVASIDLTTPAIDFVTWNEVKENITMKEKWAVSYQALLSPATDFLQYQVVGHPLLPSRMPLFYSS